MKRLALLMWVLIGLGTVAIAEDGDKTKARLEQRKNLLQTAEQNYNDSLKNARSVYESELKNATQEYRTMRWAAQEKFRVRVKSATTECCKPLKSALAVMKMCFDELSYQCTRVKERKEALTAVTGRVHQYEKLKSQASSKELVEATANLERANKELTNAKEALEHARRSLRLAVYRIPEAVDHVLTNDVRRMKLARHAWNDEAGHANEAYHKELGSLRATWLSNVAKALQTLNTKSTSLYETYRAAVKNAEHSTVVAPKIETMENKGK